MRRRPQQDHLLQPPRRREGDTDTAQTDEKSRRRTGRWPVAIVASVACVLLLVILARPPGTLPAGLRGVGIKRRIVAIGDIHGDKQALVHALQLAHLVDRTDGTAWIGGADAVVQIGDLLNKAEPRDEETLAYMADIERQARAAGGSVVVTVGDHDLHNAPKMWREMVQLQSEPFPSWMHAVYELEGTLFVHGSLSNAAFEDAGGSLDEMDRAAQSCLAGTGDKPKWIGRGDGPIWSRLYSDKKSDEDSHCDDLSKLLERLSVNRMVVGHTVRREGISSLCEGKVWRIDVGLSGTESRAGKIGASEVLELVGGEGNETTVARVLTTEAKLKLWAR